MSTPRLWSLALAGALWTTALPAATPAAPTAPPITAPAPDSTALEAQVRSLAAELRCLVCQNQTVADSQAGLAQDLRQQIREQLAAGRSPEQVLAFMTERYGDFVLYRPPLTARTALLWIGPGLLLLLSLLALLGVLRQRARLADDAFDPPTPDDDDTHPAPTDDRQR